MATTTTRTKPGSRATATIAYAGPALAEGRMDVRDLAPALLALGQTCQATNRALNGDVAEVTVYVRSDMKAGSFEVAIDLAQAMAHTTKLLAFSFTFAIGCSGVSLVGS